MTQLGERLNEQRRLAGLVLAGAALLALSVAMLHVLDAKQYERFVGAALIQSALYTSAVWLVVARHRRAVGESAAIVSRIGVVDPHAPSEWKAITSASVKFSDAQIACTVPNVGRRRCASRSLNVPGSTWALRASSR